MGQLETTFDFSLSYLMSHVNFWKTEKKIKKINQRRKPKQKDIPRVFHSRQWKLERGGRGGIAEKKKEEKVVVLCCACVVVVCMLCVVVVCCVLLLCVVAGLESSFSPPIISSPLSSSSFWVPPFPISFWVALYFTYFLD